MFFEIFWKDSQTVMYSFITWREVEIIRDLESFNEIMRQSISECNDASRQISSRQITSDRCVYLLVIIYNISIMTHNMFSIDLLCSTYTLLCDILVSVYQLLKSDKRIFDAFPDRIELTRQMASVFDIIDNCEVEIIRDFLIHQQLTQPFFCTKILAIRIVQYIFTIDFSHKIQQNKGGFSIR